MKEITTLKASNPNLLQTSTGRDTFPHYKRTSREVGDTGTVVAFAFKRTPHWVVIGKGWISNLSDKDFTGRYTPSNIEARKAMEKWTQRQ